MISGFGHTLLAFIVVLGVLIVVHEYGHYRVARWCGVKVLRFSVGFGKPLLTWRLGADRTEWSIAAFPLGGYVKMLDEREGEVDPREAHRSYNRQTLLRRSLIVAAGPFANFLLAIFLYWAVFIGGTEELRAIVGEPTPASQAAAAGFVGGERVTAVDGDPVETWQDFRWLLMRRATDQSSVRVTTINRNSEINERNIDISLIRADGLEADFIQRIGLSPYRPRYPAVVGKVVANGPAALAGLKVGDRIVAIDGKPVDEWRQFSAAVRDSIGKSLQLAIVRADETLQLRVTPRQEDENGKPIGRVGVQVEMKGGEAIEMFAVVRYPPVAALGKAFDETWDKSLFTLQMFGRMLTGEVSWRNLSGPVTIADYAGQSARLGWSYYLKFMALVSISLGVLNLLPIPLLDGGHLLYHACEAIKRGPLSEKTMEIGQQIGLAALVTLMAFAFFNDINRLLSG